MATAAAYGYLCRHQSMLLQLNRLIILSRVGRNTKQKRDPDQVRHMTAAPPKEVTA